MSTKRKELVMDTIFIAPLEQLGREDLDWAGGKGANLGELVKAGFPVPKGFVVTTDAYDYMLEITGLGRTIAAMLEEGLTAGAAIREVFMAADVPPEIDQEIAEVYGDLLGAVAVRSSATAVDLPGAAFAGQQDTYLNVVGEEAVLDAVYQPGMDSAVPAAAAVVVDSGAIGSHAAIVAREYGIPAIMGTGVGTTELKDGQLVSVDGDRGLVSGAAPQTTNH
jgi:phosphoenolpyruvate synthase/pyruvate phosphate dikinase